MLLLDWKTSRFFSLGIFIRSKIGFNQIVCLKFGYRVVEFLKEQMHFPAALSLAYSKSKYLFEGVIIDRVVWGLNFLSLYME